MEPSRAGSRWPPSVCTFASPFRHRRVTPRPLGTGLARAPCSQSPPCKARGSQGVPPATRALSPLPPGRFARPSWLTVSPTHPFSWRTSELRFLKGWGRSHVQQGGGGLRHAGPRRACGVPSPSSCSRVRPSWCPELPGRPPGWRPQAETTRGVPTPSLAGKVDVPKRGSLTRVSAEIQRLVTQTLRKLRPPNPRALLAPALHPRPGDQSPASPTHPRARHVTLEAIHPLRGQGRGLWAPSSPFLTGALGARAGRGGSTQCLQRRGVRCTHATLPEALWSPTAPGTHSTSKTTPHAPGTQPGTVPTVGDLSSPGPS